MLTFLAFMFAAVLAPQASATTGTLSGRVVEESSGAPIAGAQVLLRAIGQPLIGPTPPVVFDTTTDATGRFTFAALVPGRYMLTTTKNGYATQQAPGLPSPPPVEIVAGRTTTIDRALARGAVIIGRVTDETGEPRADARVMALRPLNVDPAVLARYANRPEMLQNFNRLMPVGQSGQTNDLGEFRIFGLPPGEYFVQASVFQSSFGAGSASRGRAYAATYYPGVVDDASAQPVTLVAGQTSDPLSFELKVVPAFQVSGTVVDESGTPVPGAMVIFLPERGSGAVLAGGFAPARTDASGQFRMPNVQAGRYQISATIPTVTTAAGPAGIGAGGGFTSFTFSGNASGGFASAESSGAVGAESRSGVTTQFRMDDASRVVMEVSGDVTGLRVVARRP